MIYTFHYVSQHQPQLTVSAQSEYHFKGAITGTMIQSIMSYFQPTIKPIELGNESEMYASVDEDVILDLLLSTNPIHQPALLYARLHGCDFHTLDVMWT